MDARCQRAARFAGSANYLLAVTDLGGHEAAISMALDQRGDEGLFCRAQGVAIDVDPVALVERESLRFVDQVAVSVPGDEAELRVVGDPYHETFYHASRT